MFKKLLCLATYVWLSTTTFNANATFVHHDIYLDNVTADVGNDFGLAAGFSGVIGFLEFNTANAIFDNIITPNNDPSFYFELNINGVVFNLFDDLDYPNFSVVEFALPRTHANLEPGPTVFEGELENANGEYANIFYDTGFGINDFFLFDINGFGVSGDLSFINAKVPEPSVLLLMVLSVFTMSRMRKSR